MKEAKKIFAMLARVEAILFIVAQTLDYFVDHGDLFDNFIYAFLDEGRGGLVVSPVFWTLSIFSIAYLLSNGEINKIKKSKTLSIIRSKSNNLWSRVKEIPVWKKHVALWTVFIFTIAYGWVSHALNDPYRQLSPKQKADAIYENETSKFINQLKIEAAQMESKGVSSRDIRKYIDKRKREYIKSKR